MAFNQDAIGTLPIQGLRAGTFPAAAGPADDKWHMPGIAVIVWKTQVLSLRVFEWTTEREKEEEIDRHLERLRDTERSR